MEPQEQITEAPKPNPDRLALKWFTIGSIFGAIVAAGAMLVITAARTPSVAAPRANDAEMTLTNAQPFIPKVEIRPENTQGSAAARITILEYSDFNCGFCRRFHDETLQRILDEYVKTGKARFSYKHYPFLAPSSAWKAEAAECAAEQGRFWDYHTLLFTQNIFGDDEASVKQALRSAAEDIRLDAAAFAACLSGGNARRRVQADAEEGQRLGVSGTPSFLINGRPLVGAQPYEAFKAIIEEELAKASSTP